SFFALEHIPDPRNTVRQIASLLNEEGVFYGIVPDTFGNVADFVVVDHVNHFTAPSLRRLLVDAGFAEVEIDAKSHRGALVFSARPGAATAQTLNVKATVEASRELAAYWHRATEQIRFAECEIDGSPIAIYGSGFYGAYIFSTLENTETVRCFLDRSPYQQGKSLFGKPILGPEHLPIDVSALLVGLNPAIARAALAQITWADRAQPKLFFLDGI
ncbi:MAG: hypothetical protein KDA51_16840, partial [Planctomycetales bacterium]|nr:hypothetical protein [Planctomycetales bacterium]